MASSVKIKQAGAVQQLKGLRLHNLPNNSDLRRLDWLVAPVYSPGWFVLDDDFGDELAVTARPAGFTYLIPGYVGKFSGSFILSAAGVDGQVLEIRFNGYNWQFELESVGGVLPGRVPVTIGGSATATRDTLVEVMKSFFGEHRVRAWGVAGVRLYGPRIVGATAGGVFGTFDYGKDSDAFTEPNHGYLRHVRPPSGFPTVSYTIENADGEGSCILETTGLDCRLKKRKERVRIDYDAGRTKVWGSVGWRQIEKIEVIQSPTAGGESLYIGYDLNCRKTLEIPFLTTYLGGAGDILTVTVGTTSRSYGLVVGGDVQYVAGATAQLTAINLANAIAGDVVAGNLPSDVNVSTDYGTNNNPGVSANAKVWISCENRDEILTLVAGPNAGPTFGAVSGTIYFDDPGEDDQWALGFPFELIYDNRLEDRRPEDQDPPRYRFHNIDGFTWLDLNAWAWNVDKALELLQGRGHGFVTGTNVAGGAPVRDSKLFGGWFGAQPNNTRYDHPVFEDGTWSDDDEDLDKQDLNTWKPPRWARPLCSAGTTDTEPKNQTQYRLFVFRLNERSKIPAFQHGEGK